MLIQEKISDPAKSFTAKEIQSELFKKYKVFPSLYIIVYTKLLIIHINEIFLNPEFFLLKNLNK